MILKITEDDLEDFYEPFARVCVSYLCEHFQCSLHVLTPPDPPYRHLPNHIGLQWFIHCIFIRTVIHPDIICSALFLLGRLREDVASAKHMRGEAVIVSALMVAHKSLWDDFSYDNTSWVEAAQFVVPLKTINCYERELLAHLRWNLDVPVRRISCFKKRIGWPESVQMKGDRFKEAMEARNGRDGRKFVDVRKSRNTHDVRPLLKTLPNGKPVPIGCLVTPAFAPWSEIIPCNKQIVEEEQPSFVFVR